MIECRFGVSRKKFNELNRNKTTEGVLRQIRHQVRGRDTASAKMTLTDLARRAAGHKRGFDQRMVTVMADHPNRAEKGGASRKGPERKLVTQDDGAQVKFLNTLGPEELQKLQDCGLITESVSAGGHSEPEPV